MADLGIFRLSDAAYTHPADRATVDKRYDVATSALFTARATIQEVQRLWVGHAQNVASAWPAERSASTRASSASSDSKVETFLNAAVRTFKQGMQDGGAELGADIGFLFKKQEAFDASVAALEVTDAPLAAYPRLARS